MPNFVKNEFFKMGGRKFRVLSGMVFDPDMPPAPDKHTVGNAVEFIQVIEQRELGEIVEVEVRPALIQNPKDKLEEKYNQWASICGVIVRPKSVLYELIEQGKIEML